MQITDTFNLIVIIVKDEPTTDVQNSGADNNFGGQSGMPGSIPDIKPEDIKPFDDGPSGGVNEFGNGMNIYRSII